MDDLVLESNETYETLSESEDAARTAYPGIAIARREGPVAPRSEPSGAMGWLALLLVVVVLLRARRPR